MWRLAVKKQFQLNHQISAAQLRVVDEEGKQIGLMPTGEALKLAQEKGVDLVEIASEAKPPVAKIIDFKKFRYLEEKKEKEARKHTKQTELKEVRFSPFIGEHDLKTGIEKVKKFLKEGNFVKVAVIFTGRQMAHQEFGPRVFARIMTELGETVVVEKEPRMEGRRLIAMIRGVKGAIEKEKQVGNETKK